MPIILGCVIILVLWLKYEIKKSNHISSHSSKDFWKQEIEANHTRNVDTSNLPYITIPKELLEVPPSDDVKLQQLHKTLLELSEKSILNLSGLSNTELKLRYGTGKFTYMSECDSNYTLLVRTLNDLGECYMLQNNMKAAKRYLLFSIQCDTEVTQSYLLLADLYKKEDDTDSIHHLMEKVDSLSISAKSSLRKELAKRLLPSIEYDDL